MVKRSSIHPIAVALGLAIDRLLGEPPTPVHPVAAFGSAMAAVERHVWSDRRLPGAAYVVLGVGGAWFIGVAAEDLLGDPLALCAAVAISSAGRALLEAAEEVRVHLVAGDLEAARRSVTSLVGRDPSTLDEKEIARAVVESLAENLSDAVVGSVLWGLAAGAPGVLAHRAANTLDAMVGHRDGRYRRFGWASARLDDVLGWPAARASALLVAVATPTRLGAVWRTCRVDAAGHPSPNAGVAEAAFAAALDLRLGGTNRYGERVEERPTLGSGAAPAETDIARAMALVRRCLVVLDIGLVGMALLAGRPKARHVRRGAR